MLQIPRPTSAGTTGRFACINARGRRWSRDIKDWQSIVAPRRDTRNFVAPQFGIHAADCEENQSADEQEIGLPQRRVRLRGESASMRLPLA